MLKLDVDNAKRLLSVYLLLSLVLITVTDLEGQQKETVNDSSKSQSQVYQELQVEKLQQEIRKLRLENDKLENQWFQFQSYAAIATAFVAVIGVFITIFKVLNERRADRKQRQEDSTRRQEEKFTSIVANLGSDSPSVRASAAVSITTFLKYKEFCDQVFMIIWANLKTEQNLAVNKLLIRSFEQAVRRRLKSAKENGETCILDLSRTTLQRIDLSGLDLSDADLGYTNLENANCTDAILYRAKGWEAKCNGCRFSNANLSEARFKNAHFKMANFQDAKLMSARMEKTDLRKAKFNRAKLQSAHLNKATLQGAQFEQADINDTYFFGADLDESTLKSILKACNWQKAHFDEDKRAALESLARRD